MDPPARLLVPTRSTRPPPISRDASLMSIDEPPSSPLSPVGDVSMSPSRPRFRLRTSLTPQPSGSDFGPNAVRRERNGISPPPLEALMENPIFVKAPPNPEPLTRQASLTLGSLAETHTRAQPLGRQHSNLTITPSTSGFSEASEGNVRRINAAELALHELEVYKTPLLPSRLRGSNALPDMFKPKKGAQRVVRPMLMGGDRDERPRLGLSDSQGAKKNGDEKGKKAKKPYEGQGGMKKLLARRRMEEEEEREKDRENAMTDEEDEENGKDKAEVEAEKKLAKDLEGPLPPVRALEPSSAPGSRPQSSLRVGRTRVARHDPPARAKPKNRFSAVYDEDEGDDMMDGEEPESSKATPAEPAEVPKPPQLFEAPKGFRFAKEAPVVQHDATAKEPPIAALPFSLTKTAPAAPVSFIPPTSAPAARIPFIAPPSAQVIPHYAAPALPTLPSFALIPPSPASAEKEKAKEAEKAESAANGSGIPNFFATSALLNKTSAQLPPASTASPSPPIAPAPAGGFNWGAPEKKTEDAAPTQSLFGGPAPSGSVASAPKSDPVAPGIPNFFGNAVSNAPSSLFGAPAPKATEPAKETSSDTAAAPSSLFGKPSSSESSGSLFGGGVGSSSTSPFGGPTKEAPSFPFAAPSKPATEAAPPTAPAASNPFGFGALAKPAEAPPAAPTTAPSFTFGAQAKVEAKTESSDTPKQPSTAPSSLFPTSTSAPTPLFTGFGSQPSASSVTSPVEAPKPFTFGQTASSAPTSSTAGPTIEAPKPLFGSAPTTAATPTSPFAFGASTSAPLPEAPAPVKSPFAFGSSAPSTPNPEKKSTFAFGGVSPAPGPSTPTPGAPVNLFGTPSGSNGADVSKGFAFGASTPVRPVTPPQQKGDNEVNMDESPVRGAGMDLNGNGPKPTLSGFGFGTGSSSSSSPFGQTSTSNGGGFGFGSSSNSSSNPFGAKPDKPAEKPTLTFSGFGQQSNSTNSNPFAFGNTTSQPAQPAAPTPGGAFAFGAQASTPTSTSSSFPFGAPAAAPSNPFGQPSNGPTSSPASPAFQTNQNTPFSFGATAVTPTSAPSNPFGFGSQPASPAASNVGLPGSQPSGFTFGMAGNSTGGGGSPSPFSQNAPLPPTSGGGGALFTMGSAPPPQASNQPRQIKKMPSRRGAKR
ncbi:hypothetical protein EIP91_002768 [Steccherinum ochraceum]|uniref:Uncharacterized protein n=1 Tax=Steccherinum ochraceum TaxID=92696 RepID=A0A4R0RBH8_9APHY|nr:hypothetical protein EIP91_002768 [Steccherinum ochraceum]